MSLVRLNYFCKGMHMSSEKEETLELEGLVLETLKSSKFRVEITSDMGGSSYIILAHIAGKLRRNNIKIVTGDRVKVEVTPYDLTRGRITYRLK